MLIVPDRFILLATPRTGSRALEKSFVQGISTQWDADGEVLPNNIRQHHVHPEDVEEVAEDFAPGSSTLPKYTVCRNPIDQLRSWFHHTAVNHASERNRGTLTGFLTFIREADISWYFTPTLNPYRKVADVILPYERNGHLNASRISQRTGAMIKTEAPVIGASVMLDDTWLSSQEVKDAVGARFEEDIKLYNEVCEQWRDS